MNFEMKVFAILLLAFNFIGVNGNEQGGCESKCFEEDQTEYCDDWNTAIGEKPAPKTKYQYDPKKQKCVQLSCLYDDLMGLMASESECMESCKDCGRVLKHYKFDDDCLKPTMMRMGISFTVEKKSGKMKRVKASAESESNEMKVYSFNIQKGECTLENIYNGKNWSVSKGVGLPTLEECNKRCPPIK